MPRTKMTKEERIAVIDGKITAFQQKISVYQEKIKTLEGKKDNILNPKVRANRKAMTDLVKQAQKSGLSVEEIAQKLGITL